MTWARAGVLATSLLVVPAVLLTWTRRPPESVRTSSGAPDPIEALDPQKGRWGGQSVDATSGFALSARVTPVVGREDLFELRIRVNAPQSDQAARTPVVFHLHPSFTPSVVRTELRDGEAELVRHGWGAFTVGAVVEQKPAPPIQLELDLASLSGAPRRFRER